MEFIDIIISACALIVLEIVLGIDNLIFLSILTSRLPKEKRKKASRWGLTFAWVTRIALLLSVIWIVHLTQPLFHIYSLAFSWRDLFLFIGGCFLITKATQEIRQEIEPKKIRHLAQNAKTAANFKSTVLQIVLMDLIFSLDSVLTAVGLTANFKVMVFAISCAILVMLYASEPVGKLIENHPTLKILALCFLILIGVFLIADSFSQHIARGYLYFAMAFSIIVEIINIIKNNRLKQTKL